MVGDILVMSDFKKISPVAVALPNGAATVAHNKA